ncbi:MAG: phosphate acyltransferase PlsX [Brevinemataceae bacterium]
MRIGVDIASGEREPAVLIKGCIDGALQHPNAEIVMIGHEKILTAILNNVCKQHKIEVPSNIQIMHADDNILMTDEPLFAVRSKPNSSIVVGLKAHHEGRLDAFFSPGNTGAIVVGASLILKRISGIKKPALATFLSKGISFHPSMLLDVGASSETTTSDLIKFGIMGKIYYQMMMNVPSPKVALLNVGEEEFKGSKLIRATHKAMKQSEFLNFYGNIEGKELFKGKAHVIVCDGFVGNIVLKAIEGTASGFSQMLKTAFKSSMVTLFGALLAKPAFQKVKDALDPEIFGGAPLLGVKGIVFIGHGSSGALAFKSAIDHCIRAIESNILSEIAEQLEKQNIIED